MCGWRSWLTESRTASDGWMGGSSEPIGRASLRVAAILRLAARRQVFLPAFLFAQRPIGDAPGIVGRVLTGPFRRFLVGRLVRHVLIAAAAGGLLAIPGGLSGVHRFPRTVVVVLNLLIVAK